MNTTTCFSKRVLFSETEKGFVLFKNLIKGSHFALIPDINHVSFPQNSHGLKHKQRLFLKMRKTINLKIWEQFFEIKNWVFLLLEVQPNH